MKLYSAQEMTNADNGAQELGISGNLHSQYRALRPARHEHLVQRLRPAQVGVYRYDEDAGEAGEQSA